MKALPKPVPPARDWPTDDFHNPRPRSRLGAILAVAVPIAAAIILLLIGSLS